MSEPQKNLNLKQDFALELENLLIWSLSDADLQELAERLTNKTKEWLQQKRRHYSDETSDDYWCSAILVIDELLGDLEK